ncbi:MAG: Nif3-like dinuclear metal center hexameric protein [Clostridiales bacterium]|jgi:dinuclear metal center YbgI/SA1388 family protein|nr:Nif3-like dinuclear metal center hexameric protein [Clostridiales bacterium]
MITASWIIEKMEKIAPQSTAISWDNVGLLIGDINKPIKKILIALDALDSVISEAIEWGADMIITHHPLIFRPLKTITTRDHIERRVFTLVRADICLFSAHTNLDSAMGGVNDVLFERLGLIEKEILITDDSDYKNIGRVGRLPVPTRLDELARCTADVLGLETIRYCGNPSSIINKVALCSGGGSEQVLFDAVLKNKCELFITGDIKYHDAQNALHQGLYLIDATHFASEVVIVPRLADYLSKAAVSDRVELEIRAFMSGQPFRNWLKV